MKGLLSEPVLLLALAVITGSLISTLLYPNPTAGLQTAQNWYDLTTKWQNLRFVLEQQTVEQIKDALSPANNCELTNFSPSFNNLPPIFSDSTNVDCVASPQQPSQNQNDFEFPVTISCTQHAAEGFGAVFSQSISYKKQVNSQLNGSNCDITIIDLESGQLDYTNLPPGPFSWTIVIQSPIEQFSSVPVSIFYENFSGPSPPTIESLDCGTGVGSIIGTCDNPFNGTCLAQCGPYDTAGNFSINASLLDDVTSVPAVSDTLTVTQAAFSIPVRGHWNFDEKNLSNQYKNQLSGAYDLQAYNTIDTRFGPIDTNHTVYFKGTNDSYLKSNSNLDLTDTNFSISFWMNGRNFFGGSQTIFSMCPNQNTGECLRLIYQPYNRNILFDIWGNNLNAQNTNVFDGLWHHIVITHEQITDPNCLEPAAKRQIFVDQTLVAFDDIPNGYCSNRFVGAPSSFCLGTWCRPDGTQTETFNGKIEDVWIFEGLLSASEIQTLYDKSALPQQSGSPLMEWLFEDAPSTEQWQDQTANHVDLVKRGNASTSTGKTGNALSLNDSTTDFAETDFIPLNNQSFSVSFWLKPPTNAPGGRTLLAQCETSGNNCLNLRYQGSGRLRFGFEGTSNLETPNDEYLVSQNVWTHAAFVFDQAQQKRQIFVNGIKAAEDTGVPPLPTTYGTTTIGSTCWDSCYDYFNGQIDQMRIWNSALNQNEITTEIQNDGGTSCYELDPYWYYNLGELQLLHRANGSFDNNFTNEPQYNGTPGGNVTNNQPGCTNTNQAYSFDGTGDFVKIADTGVNLRGNADFAVRAWFKTTQTTKGTIVERFVTNNQVSLYVNNTANSGKITFLMKGSATACTIDSQNPVNDGEWHQIIAINKTANPKKMMLFVDGVKQGEINNYNCGTWGTQTTNGFTSIGAGKTTAAQTNPNANWFDGQIDETAVWWYDISENEAGVLQ